MTKRQQATLRRRTAKEWCCSCFCPTPAMTSAGGWKPLVPPFILSNSFRLFTPPQLTPSPLLHNSRPLHSSTTHALSTPPQLTPSPLLHNSNSDFPLFHKLHFISIFFHNSHFTSSFNHNTFPVLEPVFSKDSSIHSSNSKAFTPSPYPFTHPLPHPPIHSFFHPSIHPLTSTPPLLHSTS